MAMSHRLSLGARVAQMSLRTIAQTCFFRTRLKRDMQGGQIQIITTAVSVMRLLLQVQVPAAALLQPQTRLAAAMLRSMQVLAVAAVGMIHQMPTVLKLRVGGGRKEEIVIFPRSGPGAYKS